MTTLPWSDTDNSSSVH